MGPLTVFKQELEYHDFLKRFSASLNERDGLADQAGLDAIEDIERFFGVSFINPNDEEDWSPDFLTITIPEIQPVSYPCAIHESAWWYATYDGKIQRRGHYEVVDFVYPTDFEL